MPIFQPTYTDPKTGKQVKSKIYWYDFVFAGKRIRESAKTPLKTLARMAEKNRRRELEEAAHERRQNVVNAGLERVPANRLAHVIFELDLTLD